MGEIKAGDKALVEMNIIGFDKITRDYLMRPEGDTRTFWASEQIVHTMTDKTYDDGLNEAWELAKKIICNIEYGGLHTSELEQIFGYSEFDDVLKNYTPQEAAMKIAEWEEKRELREGDQVKSNINNRTGVVASAECGEIFAVWWEDGTCGYCGRDDLTKTGRCIDIAGLLAQIGGAE